MFKVNSFEHPCTMLKFCSSYNFSIILFSFCRRGFSEKINKHTFGALDAANYILPYILFSTYYLSAVPSA